MTRAVLALLLAASPAFADEPAGAEPRLIAPTAAAPKPDAAVPFTHQGQLELSLRFALGLRAIATYDTKNYCGKTDASTTSGNAPVCASRAPFGMDLELGYGIARRIDLIAELHLGLESDFPSTAALNDGPHVLHISPGARFFFSDAKTSKLFTTAQLVFDFTGYKDSAGAGRGMDFGVRNMSGLWFDLDKAYGVYGYIGETATFARWMRFELEAGVGLQARYP